MAALLVPAEPRTKRLVLLGLFLVFGMVIDHALPFAHRDARGYGWAALFLLPLRLLDLAWFWLDVFLSAKTYAARPWSRHRFPFDAGASFSHCGYAARGSR